MFLVDWPWDDLYKGQRNDCCCKNANINVNILQYFFGYQGTLLSVFHDVKVYLGPQEIMKICS